MTFKLKVSDREYNDWEVFHASSLSSVTLQLDPVKEKLFDQDIFSIENDVVTLKHSSARHMPNIPGVLVLGRTYGKTKNGTFLYKCIPDDRRLPIFLIPHKIKLGFNKKKINKYITFKFLHWNDRHPRGSIVQVIGLVNKLDHFYEYQLYCKSLYASIQNFTKETMRALKKRSTDEYITMIMDKYVVVDRRHDPVYSIDPKGSKDFDDAFGLLELPDGTTRLSIYIANVYLWLDVMELWSSFSRRIATIYLPDRKRPMLPTILSDALCSLQEQQTRFAFTMDIFYKDQTITDIKYSNTCVKVTKNYIYEEKALRSNNDYKKITKIMKIWNTKQKYVDHINDSHDIVAALMVMMNVFTAKELQKFKTGIYRALSLGMTDAIDDKLPKKIKKFLKGWMSSGGKYVYHKDLCSHDLLKVDAYVHITSPIRRLVDLLNIINLQDKLGFCVASEQATIFTQNWTDSLPYINTTMRAIRKVQSDCSLLHLCMSNEEMLKKNFEGFIFEGIQRNDGLFQYLVYLHELNITNRITIRHNLENFTMHMFKIYIFVDEDRLKQKIRLEIII